MTSGFVTGANGIDIHYRISGDGARSNLVLINGGGATDLDGLGQPDGTTSWAAGPARGQLRQPRGSAGPASRRGPVHQRRAGRGSEGASFTGLGLRAFTWRGWSMGRAPSPRR